MWCVCNFYSSLGFHKYLSGGRHVLGTQRLLTLQSLLVISSCSLLVQQDRNKHSKQVTSVFGCKKKMVFDLKESIEEIFVSFH